MGKSAASNAEGQKKSISDSKSTEPENLFSDILRENETDEKLQELAEKLSTEWNKKVKSAKKPDLSFSKFQEKLKKGKP
ncbi:hypothetical protein [Dyadobacter arcticus]|uniref:Uncharacterized protein n=1 Tax=Dyadobacter arcticus TaxID=1078754 RepID=A0ABX0UPI0_9BACT|nr:hypothetical protein [Dyadobacter arcticus]NIJ54847.1 hypothetical protein [Dyadobacter arcticus]